MNRISSSMRELRYLEDTYALGQGARPREPHDWPLRLCRDARHCSKTAGHLSRQLLKKEQKHLTTRHSQLQFNNTQNHLQSTSPLSDSTTSPFQYHSHTTPRSLLTAQAHICVNGSLRSSRCRRRAASYTKNFSHQHQPPTNRRNVQCADLDQSPSPAVGPGDAL